MSFMTSDVWDGLVLGVVVIGLALAVLRLYSDWTLAQRQKSRPQDTKHNKEKPS